MMMSSSGWPGDRGRASCAAEESPHSIEHGAGQSPGRGNLPDRATETDCRASGDGEKAVQETTGVRSNAGGQVTPAGSKAKQG